MNRDYRYGGAARGRKPRNPESLLIAVATWNIKGSLPPHNSLKKLLHHLTNNLFTVHPHVIAIATQECQRELCMTFFC